MMAPFVLTTTEEKKKGRREREREAEAATAAALPVGGAKRMSRAPPPSVPPLDSSSAGLARVISSQVRVTFVRHYSEQGIEQARSEVG